MVTQCGLNFNPMENVVVECDSWTRVGYDLENVFVGVFENCNKCPMVTTCETYRDRNTIDSGTDRADCVKDRLLKGGVRLTSNTTPHDPVNHPSHYAEGGPKCEHCGVNIECITITREENFNIGNAIKYIWRRNKKKNPIEDLRKAIWYLNDEIQRLEKEAEDAKGR